MRASKRLARVAVALMPLVVLEATVRIALVTPAMRERLCASPAGRCGAVRWAYERAFRSVQEIDTNSDVVFDPELGWVAGTQSGVDEHGLRGVPLASDARSCDLALLGDSYAWGFGVEASETFASVLEARRPEVDVWNFGVPGYGLDQMVLRYEQQARAAPFDAVVLLALDLDLERVGEAFFFYPKPQFVMDPHLRQLPRELLPPSELRAHELWTPAIVQLGRLYAERFGWGPSRLDRGAQTRLVHALLDRWLTDVVASGARPVLLLVPTPAELLQARERGSPVSSPYQVYQPWCASHPGVCVDGWARFDALAPPPDALADKASGHWSAASHEVVAKILEEQLGTCGG